MDSLRLYMGAVFYPFLVPGLETDFSIKLAANSSQIIGFIERFSSPISINYLFEHISVDL